MRRRRTTWQPLFVRAVRRALPAFYYGVAAEVQLNQEPLRLDTAVVRKRHPLPGFQPAFLRGLFFLLGEHTLIEIKGATDQADWDDLLHLLACAALYCIEEQIRDTSQVRLIVVAPRMTELFWEQVRGRRGTVSPIGAGTYQVQGLDHLLYVIETETVSDHVLHIFSRSFLRDPLAALPLLNDEELAIFMEARLRYPDLEEVAMSLEQFMEAIIQKLPDKRVKGLSPAERLAGLAPEERVAGLAPAERLAGLAPAERLAGLAPAERLAGLAPAERLAGLTPAEREDLIRALVRDKTT